MNTKEVIKKSLEVLTIIEEAKATTFTAPDGSYVMVNDDLCLTYFGKFGDLARKTIGVTTNKEDTIRRFCLVVASFPVALNIIQLK